MMNREDVELRLELRESERDNVMFENALKLQRDKMASLLKGEMGDDIKMVTSGEVKVTIPLVKRIGFKIKCFFDKIFNAL